MQAGFIRFSRFLTVHSQGSDGDERGNFILENALVLAKVLLAQIGYGDVAIASEGAIFRQLAGTELVWIGKMEE